MRVFPTPPLPETATFIIITTMSRIFVSALIYVSHGNLKNNENLR